MLFRSCGENLEWPGYQATKEARCKPASYGAPVDAPQRRMQQTRREMAVQAEAPNRGFVGQETAQPTIGTGMADGHGDEGSCEVVDGGKTMELIPFLNHYEIRRTDDDSARSTARKGQRHIVMI